MNVSFNFLKKQWCDSYSCPFHFFPKQIRWMSEIRRFQQQRNDLFTQSSIRGSNVLMFWVWWICCKHLNQTDVQIFSTPFERERSHSHHAPKKLCTQSLINTRRGEEEEEEEEEVEREREGKGENEKKKGGGGWQVFTSKKNLSGVFFQIFQKRARFDLHGPLHRRKRCAPFPSSLIWPSSPCHVSFFSPFFPSSLSNSFSLLFGHAMCSESIFRLCSQWHKRRRQR